MDDQPNADDIEYVPLSEVAKQMGFACDHVRAARETVPLVLDGDAQGLADSEILKRLTDLAIPSDDAQETLRHVREAVQLVSLVLAAQIGTSSSAKLEEWPEVGRLDADRSDVAFELVNTAFFRAQFLHKEGRPEQSPMIMRTDSSFMPHFGAPKNNSLVEGGHTHPALEPYGKRYVPRPGERSGRRNHIELPTDHCGSGRIDVGTMIEIEPLQIEMDREEDGRFLASVPELPGVMAYGDTEDSAARKAKALALQVLADMVESGEELPQPLRVLFAA